MQLACASEEEINRKKARKKYPPHPKHHEIHSSPATASNSRPHARKHVTHVSPYSPASIDPAFVEIVLLQPRQSIKTTNVTHAMTDAQTDRLI